MERFLAESRGLQAEAWERAQHLHDESVRESRRLQAEAWERAQHLHDESVRESRRLQAEAWERSRAQNDRTLDLLRMDVQASRTLIRRLSIMHRAERRESREWMERFFRGREN